MMNNVEKPGDHEEAQLWEASQNYMRGQISARELALVERENATHLNRAMMRLALVNGSEAKPARTISHDDKERYLWMISRRYMAGDLTIEQLEENELLYTQRFNKAILSFALWKLCHRFFTAFQRNKRQETSAGSQ
jgi:hypothetical protein